MQTAQPVPRRDDTVIDRRTGRCHDAQRVAMLGVYGATYPLTAGHVMTPRDHHCGDFKDDFDWATLPAHYLRRIGGAPRKGDGHGLKT